MWSVSPAYLQEDSSTLKKHLISYRCCYLQTGAYLIVDEVQTGGGATGGGFDSPGGITGLWATSAVYAVVRRARI